VDPLLRSKSLGSAVDNKSVLYEALDKPVRVAGTDLTIDYAVFAKIKITIITDAAVIMDVVHRLVASIAVYLPTCGHNRGNWSLRHLAVSLSLARDRSKVCKEGVAVSTSGDICRFTSKWNSRLSVPAGGKRGH